MKKPIIFALFAALLFASLFLGSVSLSPNEIFQALLGDGDEKTRVILLQLRLPRVLMAMFVGGGLSLAGAALQALFRNPLADPYVLGLSSGGSLGAAIALVALKNTAFGGEAGIAACAFLGALVTAALVYRFSVVTHGNYKKFVGLNAVLLAGIALGLTFSAALSLVLYAAKDRSGEVLLWLMGHLTASPRALIATIICVTLGSAIILCHSRALDVLCEGEEAAAALGVEVEVVKRRLLLASSLVVAGAVAFCGVIGFVGLIVPHLVRLSCGFRHRALLPLSAVGGAILLVAADLAARTISTNELPVGVITGCLGGPFFLWILRRSHHA